MAVFRQWDFLVVAGLDLEREQCALGAGRDDEFVAAGHRAPGKTAEVRRTGPPPACSIVIPNRNSE
jgi:hypothetical protein